MKNLSPKQIEQVKLIKTWTFKWTLECADTNYFKVLIEGNTGIYYASPVYGHSDYNKCRMFEKNPETLKLIELFNKIVNKK